MYKIEQLIIIDITDFPGECSLHSRDQGEWDSGGGQPVWLLSAFSSSCWSGWVRTLLLLSFLLAFFIPDSSSSVTSWITVSEEVEKPVAEMPTHGLAL